MPQADASPPVVAIDVGGTELKAAIFDGRSVRRELRVPTPLAAGPDAVVTTALDTVDVLLAEAPEAAAVGVVVAGWVDEANGIALDSENIGWHDVPIRDLLAARVGRPVGFGHDVRCAGAAEWAARGTEQLDDALFLPIGTGIGAAMLVAGRELTGAYVGEIGHLDVGSGLACACGGVGCLETVASGPSIARRYTSEAGRPVAGAREVAALAAEGDPAAERVWDGAIEALARALATYVTLLAPTLIVVGGGVSRAGRQLIDPLSAALLRRLPWQPVPTVELSRLGDLAGCAGAALLAYRALAAASADRPAPATSSFPRTDH